MQVLHDSVSYNNIHITDYQPIKSLHFCRLKPTKVKLHIGKLIKQRAEELNFKVTDLAKAINTGRQNMYDIYERESIDTYQLSQLCQVLDFDFFSYYQNDMNRYKELKEKTQIAEEQVAYYFKNNKKLLDLIDRLEVTMNPSDRRTIINKVIMNVNVLVNVVIKDDLSVHTGFIYLNDETGDNVDQLHPKAIKKILLVPPKSATRNADHIQLTFDKADPDVLKLIGNYIDIDKIHSVSPLASQSIGLPQV